MPLTDKAASSAKPREKPRRLFDGGGLYLELLPLRPGVRRRFRCATWAARCDFPSMRSC